MSAPEDSDPRARIVKSLEEEFRRADRLLDSAYYERSQLVALLARLYPSGLARTLIPGWDPEWMNCVFIDTPAGQLSWHYHDREAHLFEGLSPYHGIWDGHSGELKYRRIAKLCALEGQGRLGD